MTLAEIIKQKLDRLEDVPLKFITSLQKAEKEFLKKLLTVLAEFDIKDGKILLNKRNLILLSEFQATVRNTFLETDYIKIVSNYINEFDKQAKLNNDYFAKAFEGAAITEGTAVSSIAKDVLQIKKKTTLELLLGENLDAEFINPLKEQVELAVTGASSFSDTLKTIQNIVTGDAEVDSKITRYAKQVTYDAFAVSDRTYTKIVSDNLKAEWFQWAGNIIATSRSICIENHNKYFHKKEIEAIALKDWSGKMIGTTPETIFATVGGYFCHHSLLPVSIFKVPADVVQRNIDEGNYEPSKTEVEELGLVV